MKDMKNQNKPKWFDGEIYSEGGEATNPFTGESYELNALELAKKHLKQYSYRDVAQWLTRQTGRTISHMGLKKRIQIERKRKKAATIKKRLAQRLQETLQEIEKLEEGCVGAYSRRKPSTK